MRGSRPLIFCIKKEGGTPFRLPFEFCFELFGFDSAGGAAVFASAAVDANVGIDNILAVTFGYSGYRAYSCASTAHYAFIRNYVCHEVPPEIVAF